MKSRRFPGPVDRLELHILAHIYGQPTVGLGTGLFYDPPLCRRVNDGIRDYLAEHGCGSVHELVGTLAAE